MLKTATASMTINDPTVGLPSDFIGVRDVFLIGDPRRTLIYLSPSTFSRNADATSSGKPVNYTLRANEFEFAPKPDSAYTVQMLYYFRPEAMSDSVSSNEFLANYPDALLYATLLEAEPYLMNDQRVQVWANLYNQAAQRINSSDEESEFAAVPLVMSVTSR
jgi:hypothetical protein